jgi:hypothetical protein
MVDAPMSPEAPRLSVCLTKFSGRDRSMCALSGAVVVENLAATGQRHANSGEALLAGGVQVEGILSIFAYEFPHARKTFDRLDVGCVSLTSSALALVGRKSIDTVALRRLAFCPQNDLPVFVPSGSR